MSYDNFRYLPYVTEDLSVVTDTPPFDFCPTIEVSTYNLLQGWVGATQYVHSYPYDRHQIKARILSSDYQTAINAVPYPGNLTSNLVACYAVLTTGLPSGLPVGTPIYLTPVFDSLGVTFYHEFRPLPNWTTRYISIVFLFNHDGQDDYVVSPVMISLAPYNELIDETSRVLYPDENKVFQNGQAADIICVGDEVKIQFEYAIVAPVLWTVIHERDGLFAGEYNRYDSHTPSRFPTRTDSPIIELDTNATMSGGEIIATLDSNIQEGDCFYFIAKIANPEPEDCEDEFCVDMTAEINAGPTKFLNVTWDSDFAGNAEYSFSFYYLDEYNEGQTLEWQSTNATDGVQLPLSISLPQGVSLSMTVVIGVCVYTYTWFFTAQGGVEFSDTYCTA